MVVVRIRLLIPILLSLIAMNAVAQERESLERREIKVLHSRYGGNALRQKVIRYISPSRPMEVLQPIKSKAAGGRGMLARPNETETRNGLWDGPTYFVNWQPGVTSQEQQKE